MGLTMRGKSARCVGMELTPKKLIQDGDMGKVSEIFPGKFIFILVRDHASDSNDVAFRMAGEEDAKVAKSILRLLNPDKKIP